MANRKKKTDNSGTALKSLVTVAFAEDVELANQYKELLKDNGIPAAIKTRFDLGLSFQSVAIVVPEDYLDEAHTLIEDQNQICDFYDLAFDDEDDHDDMDRNYYEGK